jgi:beta-N-acetylhexosaminidase
VRVLHRLAFVPVLVAGVLVTTWSPAGAPPTTSSTTSTSTASTTTSTTTTTTIPAAQANLACAQQIVDTWSIRAQADEVIVVSVEATNVGQIDAAAQGGFGGIILFGTTAPPGFAASIAHLQSLVPGHYTMMVMTDEEGGGVMRLTNLVGALPWAQTMGRTMTPTQITATARRVGAQLLAHGVNVDLAPVLDIDGRAVEPGAKDPDGFRSFGGSTALVDADGPAFMEGLAAAHVTSVVKHFPGLGGATGNTDDGPARTKPWTVLEKAGLVPFERAIAHGASAVMVSNAIVPGLTTMPASLSPVVMSELRTGLGFKGLIMTDSLGAGAISALHLTVPQASVRAIEAGADVVLLSSPTTVASSLALARQTSNAIVGAVHSGALPLMTLAHAAAEVLATRNTLSCAPG